MGGININISVFVVQRLCLYLRYSASGGQGSNLLSMMIALSGMVLLIHGV